MNALYSLYDALVSINVPADKARAVLDSMERDMTAILATKSDLTLLDARLTALGTSLRQDLQLLRASMTIRLGAIQIAGMGLLFAALRLTHAG